MSSNVADSLSYARAKQPRRRRSNFTSVEVSVGYVSVDVDLAELGTAELIEELRARQQEQAVDEGDEHLMIDRDAAARAHHLYRVGREAEASDLMRQALISAFGAAL